MRLVLAPKRRRVAGDNGGRYNDSMTGGKSFQLHGVPGLWPPTWPVGLTMLRLLLLPVFLWVVLVDVSATPQAHPHRWWAVAIFAVMAITDKLDGYLARRLNQTTKLGAVLDPVADKLLVACSVILLSFDWVATEAYRIPMPVVVAVYGKDFIVVIGVIAILAVVGHVVIAPRPMGKLSTFLQLTLVLSTLMAPDLARWNGAVAAGLLRALWWAVSVVAIAACADYFRLGWRQFIAARRSKAAEAPQGHII
jgi:CDP-diacylglycerol--glycerol-3-phosphate 3-phosphatidyltransferase